MGLESSTPRVRNMRLCSRKCAKWNKFSATKYILLCTSFHAFGIGINAFVRLYFLDGMDIVKSTCFSLRIQISYHNLEDWHCYVRFVTCDLTPSLLRFWDIKAMRITPEESVPKEDVKDLGKLEESLSFDGERYPVCFPWIPGHPDLPFNFNQARRQLIAVERHLKGCGKDSLDYLSPMRQYLDNSWTEAAPGPIDFLKALLRFRRLVVGLQADVGRKPTDPEVLIHQNMCRPNLLPLPEHLAMNTVRERRAAGAEGFLWKTLGIFWDCKDDCLAFMSPGTTRQNGQDSKHQLLSTVSRAFDPGQDPVQVQCHLGMSWDEPLPEDVERHWITWKRELAEFLLIRVPRVLVPVTLALVNRIELHAFCDSSEQDYGAVVYLRLETSGQLMLVNFVTAKTRLK
ncbi:hypothetical protein T4A_1983 [Trichinella pseudospiralis]|uniref:Uncharacterized protein n=2 Tax=Trichinella pseudospiralis TaxID=6337 RepID=A0A0V1E775_TRIPS|nr:hypothetical protein T4A_1983 [Trichinella pseudospiralis]